MAQAAHDRELEDLMAVLPALLSSLDALGFVGRYFNPPDFQAVMAAAGAPDDALRAALPRLEGWPEPMANVRAVLEASSAAALAAFEGLRAAPEAPEGLRAVYRALGYLPRALEALYPLAGDLPPVSRFFLEPGVRADAALQARLAEAPWREETGVAHVANEPGSRGGYSLYAPEYYTDEQAWPLVFALHGGAGNGRSFLWSWLRDARSHGAILVSPTAVGDTWALAGPDVDTPNLKRILAEVSARYRIDPERILLGGMSDGGTFSYVSGLEADSPFTHLAPVAASFHPILAQMADRERLRGLPIHIVHGVLDWMFNVAVARQARDALAAAGAQVTYLEVDDLSHTYPREANPKILAWLKAAER